MEVDGDEQPEVTPEWGLCCLCQRAIQLQTQDDGTERPSYLFFPKRTSAKFKTRTSTLYCCVPCALFSSGFDFGTRDSMPKEVYKDLHASEWLLGREPALTAPVSFQEYYVTQLQTVAKRAHFQRCAHCLQYGASIGCCLKGCSSVFHLQCCKGRLFTAAVLPADEVYRPAVLMLCSDHNTENDPALELPKPAEDKCCVQSHELGKKLLERLVELQPTVPLPVGVLARTPTDTRQKRVEVQFSDDSTALIDLTSYPVKAEAVGLPVIPRDVQATDEQQQTAGNSDTASSSSSSAQAQNGPARTDRKQKLAAAAANQQAQDSDADSDEPSSNSSGSRTLKRKRAKTNDGDNKVTLMEDENHTAMSSAGPPVIIPKKKRDRDRDAADTTPAVRGASASDTKHAADRESRDRFWGRTNGGSSYDRGQSRQTHSYNSATARRPSIDLQQRTTGAARKTSGQSQTVEASSSAPSPSPAAAALMYRPSGSSNSSSQPQQTQSDWRTTASASLKLKNVTEAEAANEYARALQQDARDLEELAQKAEQVFRSAPAGVSRELAKDAYENARAEADAAAKLAAEALQREEQQAKLKARSKARLDEITAQWLLRYGRTDTGSSSSRTEEGDSKRITFREAAQGGLITERHFTRYPIEMAPHIDPPRTDCSDDSGWTDRRGDDHAAAAAAGVPSPTNNTPSDLQAPLARLSLSASAPSASASTPAVQPPLPDDSSASPDGVMMDWEPTTAATATATATAEETVSGAPLSSASMSVPAAAGGVTAATKSDSPPPPPPPPASPQPPLPDEQDEQEEQEQQDGNWQSWSAHSQAPSNGFTNSNSGNSNSNNNYSRPGLPQARRQQQQQQQQAKTDSWGSVSVPRSTPTFVLGRAPASSVGTNTGTRNSSSWSSSWDSRPSSSAHEEQESGWRVSWDVPYSSPVVSLPGGRSSGWGGESMSRPSGRREGSERDTSEDRGNRADSVDRDRYRPPSDDDDDDDYSARRASAYRRDSRERESSRGHRGSASDRRSSSSSSHSTRQSSYYLGRA